MNRSESTPAPRPIAGAGAEAFREFASLTGKGSRAVEAWFLGPRGENAEVLERLVVEAMRDHVYWRRNFHPMDPMHVTEAVKRSPEYLDALDRLGEGYAGLLAFLKKSVPFFSMRYQGHMNWETTLPGILGYFAAMLYNPNNVAFEGSTATTILELLVGDDLCRMLGYKVSGLDSDADAGAPPPWGHITCDGTVANIEAVWSSRNLKFYPLALRGALADGGALAAVRRQVLVTPAGSGHQVPLHELDSWSSINLRVDEVLGLPSAVARALGLNETEGARRVTEAVSPFTLQNLGLHGFWKKFFGEDDLHAPVVLVPGTKHYSFPKAAALLGLGSDNLFDVKVDTRARLDVDDLRKRLVVCARDKRPVLTVVAVMGSTEESSVDPLAEVLDLRDELRRTEGIDFAVHADAAFGGYHASVEREDFDMPEVNFAAAGEVRAPQTARLSSYARRHYAALARADSVTVDPHKSGYIPYPAGALCYRNSRMRSLVTFAAPVVYHGEAEPTVGIYGVEGSKPGAAVTAVYLSHRVIRPSKSGYGLILGRALYSVKRLYARLHTIGRGSPFYAVPLAPRPDTVPADRWDALLRYLGRPSEPPDEDVAGLVDEIGPDLNILTYAFNFRLPSGEPNPSLALANVYNDAIYRELSLKPFDDVGGQDMIVSTTNLDRAAYGDVFFREYATRLGTTETEGVAHVTVLRSVVMDPWVTERAEETGATTAASGRRVDFLDTLERALMRAAATAYERMRQTASWGY